MRLTRLYLRNFLSWKEVELDLANLTGIVSVEGRTGSGKTALLVEAPTWLLYGRAMREHMLVDDVISEWRPKGEDTVVGGTLELDDGRVLNLERSRTRTATAFRVEGLTEGTATGIQDTFEGMIGLDFGMFRSCVVFGGPDVSSFSRLGDVNRKEILERLLDVDRYLSAGARAKELASVAGQRLQATGEERDQLDRERQHHATEANRLTTLSLEFERSREERIKAAREAMENAERLVRDHKAVHAKLKEAQAEQQKAFKETKSLWQERGNAAREEVDGLALQYGEAKGNRTQAEQQHKRAQEEIDRYAKDTLPEVCPFCGTARDAWPDPKRKPVADESALRRRDTALKDAAAAKASELSIKERLDEAREKLVEIEEQEPQPASADEFEASRHHGEKLKSELAVAKSKHADLLEHTENPLTAAIAEHKAAAEKLSGQITEMEAILAKRARRSQVLEYWVRGFSREGIPGFLLDAAAPYLSKRATMYARNLTDGEVSIQFDPAAAKRYQAFTPEIKNVRGGSSYAKSSKGQRAQIDVCILLALRDLMESRVGSRFGQIILDEVLDGLDDNATERAVTMLRKTLGQRTVFLVTHKDTVKALTDATLRISRTKSGVSQLKIVR